MALVAFGQQKMFKRKNHSSFTSLLINNVDLWINKDFKRINLEVLEFILDWNNPEHTVFAHFLEGLHGRHEYVSSFLQLPFLSLVWYS